LLFLCLLPSTVQSSVSFTSMAHGNTAAAVCAATLSNLIGVFFAPLFTALLLSNRGADIGAAQLIKIGTQLVLPFLAGQLLRPRLAAWAHRRQRLLLGTDRSAILLSVYTAFSAAMVQGLWTQIPSRQLWMLGVVCGALLVAVMSAAVFGSRMLGLSREDEAVVVFCGSHKSLATGIPTANVLFSGAALGPAVLPLMIYHQLELAVGAFLARRYARRAASPVPPDA
jgi:sodium/bile acid cotransporter 7